MPNRPDGKPAGVEKVTFTRPAAERIAAVVREVEQGDRGSQALTFRRLGGGAGAGNPLGPVQQFRIATFTGSWSKNSSHTITFKYAPTATATAINLFSDIGSTAATAHCAVHSEGTSWFLIAAEC
jgi:hypothetical protein